MEASFIDVGDEPRTHEVNISLPLASVKYAGRIDVGRVML